MKAADYVLVPTSPIKRNSGGTNIGGMLGVCLRMASAPGGWSEPQEQDGRRGAHLTDVRSTEQGGVGAGHSKKTLGWMGGGGGGGFFGGFAAGGAAATPIRKSAKWSPWLPRRLRETGRRLEDAAPDAKADNVQQSVLMAKPAKLYTDSNLNPRSCATSIRDDALSDGRTKWVCGGSHR